MNTSQLSEKCNVVADILKAMANPDRLRLLCAMWDSEKTVGELERYACISQSQVSQFLNHMKLESLVSSRKEGTSVYYQISDTRVRDLIQTLHTLFCNGE